MVHWILAQIQASFYIISRFDIQEFKTECSLYNVQKNLYFMNGNAEVFPFNS